LDLSLNLVYPEKKQESSEWKGNWINRPLEIYHLNWKARVCCLKKKRDLHPNHSRFMQKGSSYWIIPIIKYFKFCTFNRRRKIFSFVSKTFIVAIG